MPSSMKMFYCPSLHCVWKDHFQGFKVSLTCYAIYCRKTSPIDGQLHQYSLKLRLTSKPLFTFEGKTAGLQTVASGGLVCVWYQRSPLVTVCP